MRRRAMLTGLQCRALNQDPKLAACRPMRSHMLNHCGPFAFLESELPHRLEHRIDAFPKLALVR